ncbi:unnamed protein product [Blepharisma stoltei]|uniref:Kinesin light chain n=1 Tax=Blepharisma stoltei TaxID=1481888 RepID=A0AAU9J3K5_9CILI|nr:unnamed protein product [Blepharisma stoltei]
MLLKGLLRVFATSENAIKELNRKLSQCYSLGDYQEALSIAEQAYEESKELGEYNQMHITACSNLALMYKTVGRYENALNLYENAYKSYTNILGETHKNTVTIVHNIAATHKARGEPDKAIPLLEKIIEMRRNSENTSDLVSSLNILGSCYKDIGNLEKAKTYIKEALDIIEERFGKGNVMSVNSLNAMGLVCKANKEYELAEKYLKEALQLRENWHGESHPETLAIRHNLAELYMASGQVDKARDYLTSNVNIMQEEISKEN